MKKNLLFLIIPLICQSAIGQNVGIGTSSPAEKLHVAGNIKGDTIKSTGLKLTPNAGTGKVLTSDATGNASWQSTAASGSGNVGYGVWGDCATNGNIGGYQPVADVNGQKFDYLGQSVSVSGNFAIAGVPSDDIATEVDQGSAIIYQHNGNEWLQIRKITGVNSDAGDRFGAAVFISGDLVIIGSPSDNTSIVTPVRGSASIYRYNGGNWIFEQQLTDATGELGAQFGASVAIDGEFAFVGSPSDDNGTLLNTGSVSVFRYNGSSWVFLQKIFNFNPASDDNFGVSISFSGNYAAIGADKADNTQANEGSVCVYRFTGSTWVFMQKIYADLPDADASFGCSVSVSGTDLMIGARNYRGNGLVDYYHLSGSNWELIQSLEDVASVSTPKHFGATVYVSENFAIVGMPGYNPQSAAWQVGAAILYRKIGTYWQQFQLVTDPVFFDHINNGMGSACAVDGISKHFLSGCPGFGNGRGKLLFGKIN